MPSRPPSTVFIDFLSVLNRSTRLPCAAHRTTHVCVCDKLHNLFILFLLIDNSDLPHEFLTMCARMRLAINLNECVLRVQVSKWRKTALWAPSGCSADCVKLFDCVRNLFPRPALLTFSAFVFQVSGPSGVNRWNKEERRREFARLNFLNALALTGLYIMTWEIMTSQDPARDEKVQVPFSLPLGCLLPCWLFFIFFLAQNSYRLWFSIRQFFLLPFPRDKLTLSA